MSNTAVLEILAQVPAGQAGPADLNSYPAGLATAAPGTIKDAYGFSNCFCGSYAAWMVSSAGQQMPPYSQIGLPGYWPRRTVIQPWIVTDPQPGDIAIVPSTTGLPNGHCVYVSWVQPNGNLVAKSYNTGNTNQFELGTWAPSGMVNGSPFTLAYIRFPAV